MLSYMKRKKQINLENKIVAIKQSIQEICDIRSGSLAKQIAGGSCVKWSNESNIYLYMAFL